MGVYNAIWPGLRFEQLIVFAEGAIPEQATLFAAVRYVGDPVGKIALRELVLERVDGRTFKLGLSGDQSRALHPGILAWTLFIRSGGSEAPLGVRIKIPVETV